MRPVIGCQCIFCTVSRIRYAYNPVITALIGNSSERQLFRLRHYIAIELSIMYLSVIFVILGTQIRQIIKFRNNRFVKTPVCLQIIIISSQQSIIISGNIFLCQSSIPHAHFINISGKIFSDFRLALLHHNRRQ